MEAAALDITAGTQRARAVAALTRAFAQNGLPDAALDARLLVCAGAQIDHAHLVLHSDAKLGAAAALICHYAKRRLAHEPVSRILGTRDFWGLSLKVTPDVLDPRPDSETIVEAALGTLPDRKAAMRVLDLGTGTGALLAALLMQLPRAIGTGVDISPKACTVARENLASTGLGLRSQVICGGWDAALGQRFDLVVANPPYIETDVIATLEREVRMHDPWLALDGGPDGLTCYRAIIALLPQLLAKGGHCVLELGAGQLPAVSELASAQGLNRVATKADLLGILRALVLTA